MKWRYGPIALIVGVLFASWCTLPVFATSLKITPLEYRTTLETNEKKKGFVDISNPSAEKLTLSFEVQAFRQIDDQGGIEFYDDKDITKGVLLDLDSVELGPHETLRLMFLIDGAKLPHGEVFAAILANTVPGTSESVAQSVRVGTILEITNGSAGTHKGSITSFSAPIVQVGDSISATFTVRNEDSTGQVGGFRPTIAVAVKPYAASTTDGPLVFAGRSRTVSYRAQGNYFGLVWLQAGIGNSSMGQFVFVATGYWRWLGPMMIIALGVFIATLIYTNRKKH